MAKRNGEWEKNPNRKYKPWVYKETTAPMKKSTAPMKKLRDEKFVWLGFRDDDQTGRWGEYDATCVEERPTHRIMELEFLLNLVSSGRGLQRLYAGLLAAALVNSYHRSDLGVYPRALREAGIEIKMNLRPVTNKQKVNG